MASVIEFDISGDQAAAKGVVQAAAVEQGFAVVATSDWSFFLTRGSLVKTALLGMMAGKGLYMKFRLDFSEADGHLVARLSRGALEASKTVDAFQQLADAVGAAVTQAGIFLADRTMS
jgi:hypothetical protein